MPESVIAGDQMGVQSSGVSLVSTVDCACGRARLEAMFKQTVASIFTGPIAHLHIKVDASAVEIETAATARRVLSACGHQRATESPSLLRPHPPHPSHPTQKGGGGPYRGPNTRTMKGSPKPLDSACTKQIFWITRQGRSSGHASLREGFSWPLYVGARRHGSTIWWGRRWTPLGSWWWAGGATMRSVSCSIGRKVVRSGIIKCCAASLNGAAHFLVPLWRVNLNVPVRQSRSPFAERPELGRQSQASGVHQAQARRRCRISSFGINEISPLPNCLESWGGYVRKFHWNIPPENDDFTIFHNISQYSLLQGTKLDNIWKQYIYIYIYIIIYIYLSLSVYPRSNFNYRMGGLVPRFKGISGLRIRWTNGYGPGILYPQLGNCIL